MNILILNGSPRKNGNTKFMIDAFIEGAKKSSDITEVPVCERKIGGCGECRSTCQSACKTSCTVGNQSCERITREERPDKETK